MKHQTSPSITITYDSNLYDPKLRADWGFSCFVRGWEKSILFDTGGNGQILLGNLKKLHIQPQDIRGVFLTHDHKDHTGGLRALLKENSNLDVWIPSFFPSPFKEAVKRTGAAVLEIKSFQPICDGVYTTGVISGWIKEQSLVLDLGVGLILITACAHPRIVNIVDLVKNQFKKDLYLALGGFHLVGFDKNDIKEIVDSLKNDGLRKVAPCHCTGEDAKKIFSQTFGDNFIHTGVGKTVTLP
jgi:7,8-dihydropterin-6-yl-methyl-4-(beta-D-ribofuranosyl)aminobenzene 5'-phosphate synthase